MLLGIMATVIGAAAGLALAASAARRGLASRVLALERLDQDNSCLPALIRAAARMAPQITATCEFFTVMISEDDWACRAVRPGAG